MYDEKKSVSRHEWATTTNDDHIFVAVSETRWNRNIKRIIKVFDLSSFTL